ncbi:MAG: hypothetical protein AAGF49_10950 [Pseudomonadota bacterium]
MAATAPSVGLAPVADVDVSVRDCRCEDTVCIITLDWPEAFANVQPGQFALLKSLAPGTPLLPRPLSLVPAAAGLFIAFNILREGTQRLAECAPGDSVTLIGPLGNTFSAPETPIAIVVDAPHAGTMLALAHARAGGTPDTVIYVVDPADPHPSDNVLLSAFAATGATVVTASVGAIASHLGGVSYVAVGASNAAMAEVQSAASRSQLAGEAALQAPMACGLGICQVCAHPARDGGTFLVCDGPVFPLDRPLFAAR